MNELCHFVFSLKKSSHIEDLTREKLILTKLSVSMENLQNKFSNIRDAEEARVPERLSPMFFHNTGRQMAITLSKIF